MKVLETDGQRISIMEYALIRPYTNGLTALLNQPDLFPKRALTYLRTTFPTYGVSDVEQELLFYLSDMADSDRDLRMDGALRVIQVIDDVVEIERLRRTMPVLGLDT